MQIETSVSAKSDLKEQITEYVLSLHDVSDGTKEQYSSCLDSFTNYLTSKEINRFEDVTKKDIGQFLSTKQKQNTRNLYIFIIKSFYKNYLDNENIVEHLHQKPIEETITPSELLTPEEVIALDNEAGKRRDKNKLGNQKQFKQRTHNRLLTIRPKTSDSYASITQLPIAVRVTAKVLNELAQ